jgi:hypothetical protein
MAVGFLAKLTIRNLSSNCEEKGAGTICHDRSSPRGISPAVSTIDFVAAALF